MIIYQKKNVNNWIKNGVKRKKGYQKKKILLPLRIKVGNFLQKEKAKGIRLEIFFSTFSGNNPDGNVSGLFCLKEIVKKMGIKLITGEIVKKNSKNLS